MKRVSSCSDSKISVHRWSGNMETTFLFTNKDRETSMQSRKIKKMLTLSSLIIINLSVHVSQLQSNIRLHFKTSWIKQPLLTLNIIYLKQVVFQGHHDIPSHRTNWSRCSKLTIYTFNYLSNTQATNNKQAIKRAWERDATKTEICAMRIYNLIVHSSRREHLGQKCRPLQENSIKCSASFPDQEVEDKWKEITHQVQLNWMFQLCKPQNKQLPTWRDKVSPVY